MMKMTSKLLSPLVLVLLLSTGNQLTAQSNWEAGVRFGDNFSVDLTIPLAASPRLHTAIYFDRFGVGGYFDWMFALSGGPRGLKFYPGFGPEFFFGDSFDFHIAGDFGVEYSFNFPLTIGLDWRPGFEVTEGFNWKSGNWGLIARFRFGEGVKFVKSN
jgi:hypothetical protein